jgi:hypothetical protein
LSSEPDDYFVRRYGVNQEVYGEGDIGGFLGGIELKRVPR